MTLKSVIPSLVFHVPDMCGFKKFHALDVEGVGGTDYVLSIIL